MKGDAVRVLTRSATLYFKLCGSGRNFGLMLRIRRTPGVVKLVYLAWTCQVGQANVWERSQTNLGDLP